MFLVHFAKVLILSHDLIIYLQSKSLSVIMKPVSKEMWFGLTLILPNVESRQYSYTHIPSTFFSVANRSHLREGRADKRRCWKHLPLKNRCLTYTSIKKKKFNLQWQLIFSPGVYTEQNIHKCNLKVLYYYQKVLLFVLSYGLVIIYKSSLYIHTCMKTPI